MPARRWQRPRRWAGFCLLLHGGVAAAAPPPVPESLAAATRAENLDVLGHEIDKGDRAIDETKRIIRASNDAPYLPDLYFRLAELYVQRSRFEHARASLQQEGSDLALSAEQSMGVQLSKKLAMETYDKILVDFPDYERREQIHFFKGHEARELNAWDLVIREYTQLIDRYPKGKWAAQARLVLGDHAQERGDVPEAERLYLAALAAPESAASPLARYKLGWLRTRQENYRDALELFHDAITTAEVQPGGRRNDVRREALLALTWPYSEVRRPGAAFAYLQPLADSRATYLEALRKLALRYQVKDKAGSALLIWREILRLDPVAEENVDTVARVVNTDLLLPEENGVRHAAVDADVASLAATYLAAYDRPLPMRARPGAPSLDLPHLQRELELHARDMATRAQTYAQKHGDAALEARVATAYSAYLGAFGRGRDATTQSLNRAGALFDAGSYLESAQVYEAVAGHTEAAAQVREPEVYNALLGYWRALEEDAKKRESSRDRSGTLDMLQLLRAREGLRNLGAFYLGRFPRAPHVPEIRFNVARMVYQQGEFEQAATLLAGFVRDFPNHKDTAGAGRLALDALYKLERLDAMAQMGEAFAHDGRIKDAAFRAEAGRLANAARRRKVEVAVVGATEADFAQTMLAEWEKHRGSKEGEDYLYAAFTKYRTQGDLAATLIFGEKLMGAYTDSRYGAEVLGTMAAFAAQSVDLSRAAALYELLARRYPKDKGARPGLQSALDLRLLLGDVGEAAQDLTALRALGGGSREAETHLWQLHAQAGSWRALATATAAAAANRQGAGCFYAGLAASRQGDAVAARALLACAVRATPQEGEDALQARAAFELAQLLQHGFDGLQFRGASDAEVVLRTKLQNLGEVEAAYVAALRQGDSLWGLAASHQLVKLYETFAAFLVTAPAPAGIAPATYRAALQEQADPYLDKARQTLKACAGKATELRLLSPYGRACLGGAAPSPEEQLTPRTRPAAAREAAYLTEMARLRAPLLKAPKAPAPLWQLLRRALQAGDYPYARLLVDRLEEVGAGVGLASWRGLVLWHLGDLSGAATNLEIGRKAGQTAAAANLAGLYASYGLAAAAREVQPTAARLQALGAGEPPLHPLAQRYLDAGSAEGRP